MAIKAILPSLDQAPEALREHYTEQDGKFFLSVEAVDGYALENVNGLKSALGAERTKREQLERDVVKFKDIDPDKARTALAKLQELGDLDPTKEADKIANTRFEAAKAQLLEKHQGEIGQRDERIGMLTSTVDDLLRRQRATAAIAAAKGSVDLLLPHVLAATRTVEKDGKFAVEVVDPLGNIRIGDGKGTPMDLDALVTEMRSSATFKAAFEGEGHGGGGKQHDKITGPAAGDMGGDRNARQAAIRAKFGLTE